MKKIIVILGLLALTGCTSTHFVDCWRNSQIATFQPKKILVLGMTGNLTALKIFEQRLTDTFQKSNINAF